MACPHASGCPLFPLMNESVNAWRTYYCDSSSGWGGCARYVRSSQGEIVPLGLLPNGRHAQHIQTYAGESAPAEPPPATLASLPPVSGAAPRGTAHVPAPATARPLSRPDDGHPGVFEPIRTFGGPHTIAQPADPSAIPQQRLPADGTQRRSGPNVRHSRRRWWTRLTDWMTGRDE